MNPGLQVKASVVLRVLASFCKMEFRIWFWLCNFPVIAYFLFSTHVRNVVISPND